MIDFSKFIEFSTRNLIIRQSELSQAPAMLDYFARNREHFNLAMHDLPESFYSLEVQQKRLESELDAAINLRGLRLYIYEKHDRQFDNIIGDIGIFRMNFYPAYDCEVSFKIDRNYEVKGIMKEAMAAVISFIFNDIGIHRICGHTLPENKRSQQFLRSLGFQEEGISRAYLHFAGKWRDHLRFSLIKGEYDNG